MKISGHFNYYIVRMFVFVCIHVCTYNVVGSVCMLLNIFL